jgi:hypothetical protein
MDNAASVIDTSAMVRMNASWESKQSCSIVVQALDLVTIPSNCISHCGVSRSLFWTQHAAELERDACR